MACFASEAELAAAFLGKLDPDHAQYALKLLQKDIKTPHQLAKFSQAHHLACGTLEAHIDDMEARADVTGGLLVCFGHVRQHLHRAALANMAALIAAAQSCQLWLMSL